MPLDSYGSICIPYSVIGKCYTHNCMTSATKFSRAALPVVIKYTKEPYRIAGFFLFGSLEVFDLKFQLLGGFLRAERGGKRRDDGITSELFLRACSILVLRHNSYKLFFPPLCVFVGAFQASSAIPACPRRLQFPHQ